MRMILTLDPSIFPKEKYTHSHVRLAASVNSFSDRINQVPRNSKVAHFYAAFPVYQYVAGLNIPMDDLELAVKVMKSRDNLYGKNLEVRVQLSRLMPVDNYVKSNLPKDILIERLSIMIGFRVKFVKAGVHALHADPNIAFPK